MSSPNYRELETYQSISRIDSTHLAEEILLKGWNGLVAVRALLSATSSLLTLT